MEITLLEKGNKPVDWVRFTLEGKEVNPAFANTIRRILRTEIPVLAIEDILVMKNTSALYDEMLALRLGLIPLTTPDNYVLPSECGCGSHCPKCSVTLTISKKGPGWVYSSDIKSQDPKVKPVSPNIPIVFLTEWQELELEMVAQMGVGKEHMKWQATLPSYQYYPSVKVKKPKEAKPGIEACPRGVFDKSGNVKNVEACNLCRACIRNSPKGAIEIKGDEHKYIFSIESFGNMSAKDTLIKAGQVIEKKATEFLQALE